MSDPIQAPRRARRPSSGSPSTARAAPRQPTPEEEAERAIAEVESRRASVSSLRARRSRRVQRPPLPLPNRPNEIGLYVRSFHFSESFGGGFDGDDRGFAADQATARIHAGTVLAPSREGYALDEAPRGYSDSSSHPVLGSGRAYPEVSGRVRQISEDTTELTLDYEGSMPLLPAAVTPDIDVHARFRIRETSDNQLHVRAQVRGDAFPNAEAIIRDHRGQRIILGVHSIDVRQSPVTDLPGDGNEPMIKADLTVERADDGRFLAVVHNGERFSVDAWNARLEARAPEHGHEDARRETRERSDRMFTGYGAFRP
jgi:hypothetical protein